VKELVSKHFSAFCPAPGKNFATVSVRHSFAKAVLHTSMALLWLIGSFHALTSVRDSSEYHHNRMMI